MRALICSQGVSPKKNYMRKHVERYLGGYSKIVYIDSEKHLATWSLFGIWDRFGDWFEGVYKDKHILIAEDIKKAFNELQEQGYMVDGLGHSFGTIPLYSSECKFNNLIFTGSPLTSRISFVQKRAREAVGSFQSKAECFLYLFNNKDRVCSKPYAYAGKSIKAGHGHKFKKYCKELGGIL